MKWLKSILRRWLIRDTRTEKVLNMFWKVARTEHWAVSYQHQLTLVMREMGMEIPEINIPKRKPEAWSLKAVKFPQANRFIGAEQKEYHSLPAYIDPADLNYETISCWEISEAEAMQIMSERKIFLSQMTFGGPLQPVSLSTIDPFYKPSQNTDEICP